MNTSSSPSSSGRGTKKQMEEEDEILSVYESKGQRSTMINLVPNSRLSEGFRKYLKALEKELCPWTVKEKYWEKLVLMSKGMKPRKKENLVPGLGLETNDTIYLFNEAMRVSQKRNQHTLMELMPILNYLKILTLNAKLVCLASPCGGIDKEHAAIKPFLEYLERSIRFQKDVCEDMMVQGMSYIASRLADSAGNSSQGSKGQEDIQKQPANGGATRKRKRQEEK